MKYRIVAIVCICAYLTSCETSKEVTTESGLKVSFINKGESPATFVNGDIVMLNLSYSDSQGKELFSSKDQGMPLPLRCDTTAWQNEGAFYEAISLCGKGDSISFSLSVNDFFLRTTKSPIPDSLNGEELLKFNVGFIDIMGMEEYQAYMTEIMAEMSAEQAAIDAGIIDKYVADNGLEVQQTESGLNYVITTEGAGDKPVSGNLVTVAYRGAFLDDREFDSGSFEFALGAGRVIRGWDEGIGLLKKGTKATLIIPSALGYGERGSRGAIPPNTVLKFDVELIDIKN